jgi:hypothetical protein
MQPLNQHAVLVTPYAAGFSREGEGGCTVRGSEKGGESVT